MAEEMLTASQDMIRLLMGFVSARAAYAAAKLGLPDQIDAAGSSAKEIASRVGLDPSATERLLRTLTGLGVLRGDALGRFFLTELGSTLRSDAAGSVRSYAIYVHEFLYELFAGLATSVRSGKPAVEEIFGAPLFAYLQANPEKAALFHAGLGNRGQIEAPAILAAYSFSDCRRIVDLGGGNGAFLSAILTEYPGMSGVLLERAPALAAAQAGGGGPLPRCELIEGDYFKGVPANGDIYVCKRVLFDHTLDEVVQIFRNCRRAMGPNSRLLIIEPLAGTLNEPNLAHLMDLTYLLATTGRMRTEDEYRDLLHQAGLSLRKCLPTQSDVSLLEAVVA